MECERGLETKRNGFPGLFFRKGGFYLGYFQCQVFASESSIKRDKANTQIENISTE